MVRVQSNSIDRFIFTYKINQTPNKSKAVKILIPWPSEMRTTLKTEIYAEKNKLYYLIIVA
jgi:hypothetical protein